MQVQIELPAEVGARLVAEAQVRGLALERYIVEKLENSEAAALKGEANAAARLADMEQFFQEMARYSDEIPLLPDEAYTRRSFYQDHD